MFQSDCPVIIVLSIAALVTMPLYLIMAGHVNALISLMVLLS
jgi:hypothetical protein